MTEPAPTEAPTSTARVLSMLTLPETTADEVAPVVAAVNSLVRGWLKPAPDGEWDPAYVYGATLLAARLYRRRDSAEGVMSGFGVEGAMYVQRNDPDVAMLLRMGAYAPPVVG